MRLKHQINKIIETKPSEPICISYLKIFIISKLYDENMQKFLGESSVNRILYVLCFSMIKGHLTFNSNGKGRFAAVFWYVNILKLYLKFA